MVCWIEGLVVRSFEGRMGSGGREERWLGWGMGSGFDGGGVWIVRWLYEVWIGF